MSRPRYVRSAALQQRITEMQQAKQTTPSQPQANLTEPAHPQASLLGLPAELRTYIFELAVFHESTDGIIAPLSDSPHSKECMTLVRTNEGPRNPDILSAHSKHWSAACMGPDMACERFRVDRGGQVLFRDSQKSYGTALSPVEEVREIKKEEYLRYLFSTSVNAESKHLCTLDCLVQPAVTKVSRQVREETLHAFYSINHFHFEMGNFQITTGRKIRLQRSPNDWWRASGDTNLREIRHLSIVGHPFNAVPEHGVIINYNKRQNTVSFINKERMPEGEDDQGLDYVDRIDLWNLPLAATDPKAVLGGHVDVLKENGVHVRVLECILAGLEPMDQQYLSDRSALE